MALQQFGLGVITGAIGLVAAWAGMNGNTLAAWAGSMAVVSFTGMAMLLAKR